MGQGKQAVLGSISRDSDLEGVVTRPYSAKETQTGFLGWVRNNPRLDSVIKGLTLVDSDAWFHRYRTYDDSITQFIMLVEFKEWDADVTPSQRDTLHIVNQLLRNRRNKKPYWNAVELDGSPRIASCYSTFNKKTVNVICYGVHCLQMSGDGTYAQWSEIKWDRKTITYDQLEQLLLFNIDPDDFAEIDHRPWQRHKTTFLEKDVLTPLGFYVTQNIKLRS